MTQHFLFRYTTLASQQPILPTFAHNPTVEKVGNLYVLAHIGCGEQTTKPVATCFNGTTCTTTPAPNCSLPHANTAGGTGCDTPHWTGLLTAPSLNGPWKTATAPNKTMVITPDSMPKVKKDRRSIDVSTITLSEPKPLPEMLVSTPPWHSGGKFTNPSIWYGRCTTVPCYNSTRL